MMRDSAASNSPARSLVHLPVIHTKADLGALYKSVASASRQMLGKAALQRKEDQIDQLWNQIENYVDALDIQPGRVRLYQDGLPVCGREAAIVRELAGAGSRNHNLLLRLMEKGATLMGTEAVDLLVAEYQLVKKALETENSGRAAIAGQQDSVLLLARRDRYIAERINRTLRPGETGILFLGMLHTIEKWLARDIRVVSPQFQRDY